MPITAGRAVIATIDPADVLARTGEEHFPAGAVEQVRRFRHGLGALKVDWALDGPVPWIADPCREAAVVHVGDTVTDMSRSVWEAAHGLLPARPTLVLGQQSLADPTRAPAGQHTLWGYARVPPRPRGDAAHDDAWAGEEIPWDRVADRFATRMEALIQEYAPGFRDRILARRVWTPGALRAADATLVDGDISGGSFAIDQQLLFRPGPRWWRWGSPLKGLYLAGASVPPGGGVHGGGGDQAARQALADFRRPGMLVLAGAGAAAATTAALRLRSRGRAAGQVWR
jgi:phytoene dehydrogenase-like protein